MIGLGAGTIEFFRSLANSAEAGIPITRAVTILQKGGPRLRRDSLEGLRTKLDAGISLADAMAAQPDRFQVWQIEIVRVGEATGRLDAAFRAIAELLEERRAFMLSLLSGLAYPLFLLHVAPFLLYGAQVISGGLLSFAISVIVFLLWFYVPAGLIWLAWSRGRLSSRILPFASSFGKAQFSFYLSALIKAAVPLRKALEIASQAAGLSVPGLAAAGESVVSQLRRCGVFNEEELARIEVAEESGKIDEDLARLATQSREKWQATLKAVAAVLPVVIYLVIGLTIAYRVVSFYNGYFGEIDSIFH